MLYLVKRNLSLTLLILSILLFLISPNQAQQADDTGFRVQNVELRTALEKFAQLYDIDILFADALVEGRLISCEFTNLSIDDALEILLAGTEIAYRRVSAKQLVFYDLKSIPKFTIAGRVVDRDTGERLAYANVRILGSHAGTSTDSDGRFILHNVPARLCTVRVEYIGYNPDLIEVNARNLQPELDIRLRQFPVELPRVLVKAQTWDMFEISESVGQMAISPMNFEDLPAIGDRDILRSLQLMPGISTGINGTAGVNIRGGATSENLVLLDGMTLYHIDHTFGLISAVNPDAIQDVQVYKGSFPAKYGGRLSGVLELTAKTGNFDKPRLNVNMNRISGSATAEVPLGGKGAIFFSGRRSHSSELLLQMHEKLFEKPPFSDEFIDYPDLELEHTAPDISFYDMLGKVTVAKSDRDVLSASGYLGKDRVSTAQFYPDGFGLDEVSSWGSKGFSGQWHRLWSPGFNTNLLFALSDYFTDFDRQVVTSTPFASLPQSFEPDSLDFRILFQNDLESQTLRLDNELKLARNVGLEFGAIYTRTNVQFAEEFPQFFKRLEQNVSGNTVALYSETDLNITNQLKADLGLRTTYYDVVGRTYWEPRFSMQARATRDLIVKAALGQNYQFVLNFGSEFPDTERQLTWLLVDDEVLRPARSDYRVIGFQLERPSFLLDVELYDKSFEGLIEQQHELDVMADTVHVFPIFTQRRGNAKGFDLILEKKFGSLTSWLSYSFNRTNIDSDLQLNLPGYPADSDTRHNLKLVGTYRLNNWGIAATWQFASGVPYTEPDLVTIGSTGGDFSDFLIASKFRNQKRLPSTQRLDMSLTYRWFYQSLRGKFGISLFNVFDRRNVWYRHFRVEDGEVQAVDIMMFGRTPSLTVEVQFN